MTDPKTIVMLGMAALECNRPGHAVSVPKLRQACGLSKETFDAAVYGLACDAKLDLMRYDYTQGLTDAERADLLPDGNGEFYIGVALSQ